MTSYLVNGQLNLNKSHVCAGDFIRYLHDLPNCYRLSEYGDVAGKMDRYGILAKSNREKQLLRFKQEKYERESKGKKTSVNFHNQRQLDGNDLIELARKEVPKEINLGEISTLWNMDLAESLMPFQGVKELPEELLPQADECITINNVTHNLANLTEAQRAEVIDKWQKTEHINKKDTAGPAGYIFGLQEIPFKDGNAGDLEKTGHTFLYDRTAEHPRAAIIASKNLRIFLDTDLTGPDMCVAKFFTPNKQMKEVIIISLYCDIKAPKDEIIPKNLERAIKRAIKENTGIIIYADLNAHSHLWMSKKDNDRGKFFEQNLITRYGLHVLNNCDTPSYYGPNTEGTIPDVTLCTPNMIKFIRNWLNRDGASSSDHASYEHTLFLADAVTAEPKFKFKQAKTSHWFNFQHTLENKIKESLPTQGDYELFNSKVDWFTNLIHEALEETIAKTKPRPLAINQLARGEHWYTKKCEQLYNRIAAIRKHMRKVDRSIKQGRPIKQRASWAELPPLRSAYWREIDKAKHNGFKKFVETREGSSQMGSFNQKILKKANTNAAIPLFKRANGTTMTPDETAETFLKEHFPDCRDEVEQLPFIEARKAKELNAKYNLKDNRVHFITLEKVKASINSFQKHKGVGSDRIPPIVYQWFGPKAWTWLHNIYQATYLLKLLPRTWLDVKVLFIPKAGKKSLCEPRSWRPISLMQYQMKGNEKLLIRENEFSLDGNGALHNNQHGFRKQRSCISSLSSKVGRIEKALRDHGFALAVYLDIKGAFDNVQNNCIKQACKEKGCKDTFIEWFADFFNNRSISFEFKGKTYKRYCAKGTPQGSTASPYFWNLIADKLHYKIDEINDVDSEGFADDTCFISIGNDQHYIQWRMQHALQAAELWAQEHNLQFSASKTVVILYTNKRKYDMPAPLTLNGEELKYKDRVKHLGLNLTSNLNWSHHLGEKIKEAKGIICRLKGSMGKLWGLKPKMAMWVYRMVVRPILSYASVIWAKIALKAEVRQELKEFQAFALHQMGYFRAKTPQNALEVITNTIPLDLHLLYDAQLAFIRTKGHEKYSKEEMITQQPMLRGHRQVMEDYAWSLIGATTLLNTQLDDISPIYNFDNLFKIDRSSMDPTNEKRGIPIREADCNIYSDGSRFGPFKCGAGISVWKIYNENCEKSERVIPNHERISFYLEEATIFQCENYGVMQAANWLAENHQEYKINSAIINVDSQACIYGLASSRISSKTVQKTISALNESAKVLKNGLTIRWVKAHVDQSDNHRGNVFADGAARLGAEGEGLQHPDDLPQRSYKSVKTDLKQLMIKEWNTRWTTNPFKEAKAKDTKLFFPQINPKKSYELIQNSSRYDYSKIIQAITGCNHLAKFENKIGNNMVQTPKCTYCKIFGTEESTIHFLTDCEAFAYIRLQIFGVHNPAKEDIMNIKTKPLIEFLNLITWFPEGSYTPETGESSISNAENKKPP